MKPYLRKEALGHMKTCKSKRLKPKCISQGLYRLENAFTEVSKALLDKKLEFLSYSFENINFESASCICPGVAPGQMHIFKYLCALRQPQGR